MIFLATICVRGSVRLLRPKVARISSYAVVRAFTTARSNAASVSMRPIGIGISSPQAPEHKQLSSPEQLAQQGPLLMQVVARVSYLGNAMSTRTPATYHSHTETHTHRAWDYRHWPPLCCGNSLLRR